MKLEEHPAAESVFHLQRGAELIRRLTDEQYRGPSEEPFRGGVGGQFRHCIDFYGCFLEGIARDEVDYTRRERDDLVATDRSRAIERIGEIVAGLAALDRGRATGSLRVRSDNPAGMSGRDRTWSGSTVERELQFLVSHTIHHYALIVALLRLGGHELGSEFAGFGVAPSTLEHWKARGAPAP